MSGVKPQLGGLLPTFNGEDQMVSATQIIADGKVSHHVGWWRNWGITNFRNQELYINLNDGSENSRIVNDIIDDVVAAAKADKDIGYLLSDAVPHWDEGDRMRWEEFISTEVSTRLQQHDQFANYRIRPSLAYRAAVETDSP